MNRRRFVGHPYESFAVTLANEEGVHYIIYIVIIEIRA